MLGEEAFKHLQHPRQVDGQRAAALRFADPRVQSLAARERSTARTILDRSGGITGEIAEMLTLAASRAVRRREERIPVEILD